MPSYVFLTQESGGFGSGKTELRYARRNIFDTQMLAFVLAVLKRELPERNTIEDSLELMRILNDITQQLKP